MTIDDDQIAAEQDAAYKRALSLMVSEGVFKPGRPLPGRSRPSTPPTLRSVADRAPDPSALPTSASGLWEYLHLETNGNGIPHTNLANVAQAITAHPDTAGHLWFDEFYGGYFTDWDGLRREWSDADDRRLTIWVQSALGLRRVGDDLAHKAVQAVGDAHPRNDPRDWLNGLTWDGQPRVHTSLSRYFGVKQAEYTEAVAGNFWISMAARIMEPGCKVDNMLVLEAAQGARKSSALNVIGGVWYCEAHESVMSKDFFLALRGKLVVEIGELDSFSRAENTKVKQVITCRSDRYRAPYGRATQDYPRMNVFVGTTNDDSYLHDSTGARRFWPIRCRAIDTEGLAKDREQLFAEAIQLYREGHTWWETPPDQTAAQQEGRRTEDPWEEPIRFFLQGRTETSLTEVMEAVDLKVSDQQMRDAFRLGHVLRTLGWQKHVRRRDGKFCKVWLPNERLPNERGREVTEG